MALNTDNVRVGSNGRLYVGSIGSTAPTDVTTAWDAAWKDFGYLSDDGVSMPFSTENEDINAWQSLSPVRRILTGVELTFQFTALEFKRDVITLFFPDSTISTSGGVHTMGINAAPDSNERAFGLEWTDKGFTHRLVIPRGEVTDRGEVPISRSGAVGLQMTVTAYATSSPDLATWLTDDTAWAA